MPSVKDNLIILRTIPYSESDLVIHGLNRMGGRINLIAKGARKSQKRFGGGILQPTHYVEVEYKQRKSEGDGVLHFLEAARLIEGFQSLRQDYDRLETAFYFLQLMSKVSQEGVTDAPENFLLLGQALRAAETSNSLPLLKTHFEVKVLYHQGVLSPNPAEQEFVDKSLEQHQSIHFQKDALKDLRNRLHFSLNQFLGITF